MPDFNSKSIIVTLGILFSAVGGIWAALGAYFSSDAILRYPGDWRWFLFYCGLILAAVILVWFYRGRLMLTLCSFALLSFIGLSCVRGGLVKEMLAFLWLIILAAGLGDVFLGWVSKGIALSPWERLMLGLALGFGGLMVCGLLLGTIGEYNRLWAFTILGILTILTLPSWLRWMGKLIKENYRPVISVWNASDLRVYALAAAVFGIFFISPYLWASAPTIRWDALSYHVAAPSIYIDHGAMVEIPESAQTYWAHYAEMLYTLGMLLAGQPLPGWIHLAMGLGSAAFAGLLGEKIVNRRVGIFAALLFFTLPLVNYEIGTAYMEGFTTLYITVMLYAGFSWWQQKSVRWLTLAGIFAGLALGLKLNTLPFVIVFTLILIIFLIKQSHSGGEILQSIISFSVPVIILWSPWLIRDALWTGNPIFPNYNGIFKSPKWAQTNMFAVQSVNSDTLVNYLEVPWEIVTNSIEYYHEAPGGALLALPWLMFPWGYLGSRSFDRSRRRIFMISIIYITLTSILLFSVARHARYLMPIYPLMSVLAATNIDVVSRYFKTAPLKWILISVGVLIAIAYLIAAQASILIRSPVLGERYPYRIAFGLENQNSFLERTLPFYTAFQYLDQQPDHPKVFSLGVEFRLYTRARIYGGLFSNEVQEILKKAKTPSELANLLEKYDFKYLLISAPDQRSRPRNYSSPALTSEFFDNYTRIVHAHNRTYLYRLYLDDSPPAVTRINMLKNPGFEDIVEGAPASWTIAGNPVVDQTGKYARTGNSAVLLCGPESLQGSTYFVQMVPVEAGRIYTIRSWGRADTPETLQLMIRWLDHTGNILRMDYDWIPLSADWKNYGLSAQAPAGAATAEVSIAVTQDQTAWIDDGCFTQDDNCPE